AVELLAVHGRHGIHGVLRISKRNEAEPAGAVGFAVLDDLGLEHFAELFESSPEPLVGGVPAQASNKEFLRHDTFSFNGSRDAIGFPISQLTEYRRESPHHRSDN